MNGVARFVGSVVLAILVAGGQPAGSPAQRRTAPARGAKPSPKAGAGIVERPATLVRMLTASASALLGSRWSSDGSLVAAAGREMTATVWDAVSGETKATFTRPSAGQNRFQTGLSSIALSVDTKTVATGGEDGQIDIWELASGTRLYSLNGHKDAVHSLSFDPTGSVVASVSGGSFDYTARVWDLSRRSLSWTNQIQGIGQAVTFDRAGDTVAVAAWDRVLLIERASGKTIRSLDSGNQHQSALAIAYSLDQQLFAASGDDQIISLWRTDSWSLVTQFKEPGEYHSVSAVAFTTDGKQVVAAGADGLVSVWSVAEKTLAAHLRLGESASAVSISPDGHSVSASTNRGFGIWKIP
jgi:WD40 repeat protein